jgi:hypothetical protein
VGGETVKIAVRGANAALSAVHRPQTTIMDLGTLLR